MKITVYGNCQSGPLLNMLRHGSDAVEALHTPPIHTLDVSDVGRVDEIVGNCDAVLHQPIAGGGGDLASEALKTRFPKVKFISFPSIYFGGFFPHLGDLRYQGGSLRGPLDGIHDGRILRAFLTGVSLENAAAAIMEPNPKHMEHYAKALKTSRDRDVGLDIPIMKVIEDQFSAQSPMYTMNHPNNAVLWHVASRTLDILGLQRHRDVQAPGRPYLDSADAAIPNDIPEALGLPWRREHWKVRGVCIGTADLVAAYYDIYSAYDNLQQLSLNNAHRFAIDIFNPI